MNYKAITDGRIGIASGMDAYTMEISKGDIFEEVEKDSHWVYVKTVTPRRKMVTIDQPYGDSYVVQVDWSKVLFTFPIEDAGNNYAKFEPLNQTT
jgi:hypothetical protein